MLYWKNKVTFLFVFITAGSLFGFESFEYKDALGQVHRFTRPPVRIISLMPSITETLFAIGAGSRVVGVTRYCLYPKEAQKLPKIGDLNLNYEQVVALNPDLIIGDPVAVSKSIEKLRSLRLPVLAVRMQQLVEIPQAIRDLGRITGSEKQAEETAANIESVFEQTRKETAFLDHPRVFLEVWDKPLMTVGKDAFLGELITIAGGKNVSEEITKAWAQISEEVVIQKDPEIILLLTSKKEHWISRPQWQGVSAIKSGRIFELDRDLYSHPSPRIGEALKKLVWLLHPDH